MALHAIKAGEGDVFISAGVEMVSRFVKGNSDAIPDTQNPRFEAAAAKVAKAAESGADSWRDPREDGDLPKTNISMGQTAENLALLKNVSRQEMDGGAGRGRGRAGRAGAGGGGAREGA